MNATPSSGPLRGSVLIVGAGPAGAATALRLAQRGVENILLVDASDFPRPKTCGSGLSPRGVQILRELGLWEQIEKISYRIDGMILTTPGRHTVELPAQGQVEAYVCARNELDHAILQAAIDAGVTFVPKFRASELIEEGGRVRGVRTADGKEARGTWTVIATGAHAPLAVDTGPKHTISTIMGWWEDFEFRDNWLEMVFDEEIVPYYGWMFPETAERVNIGITYEDAPGEKKKNARQLFQRFLDRHYGDRLKTAKQIGAWRGHPIVFCYQLPKLFSPGRVVVGEAGRLTHPATGEGISQGIRSGVFAADALANILEGQSATLALTAYQTKCVAAFTPSFLAGGLFLKTAKPTLLDTVGAFSKNPSLAVVTRTVFSKI